MITQHDLFVSLATLRREGLTRTFVFMVARIEVSLNEHQSVFQSRDLAADWLASGAVLYYPRSDFVKQWHVIAKVLTKVAIIEQHDRIRHAN